MGSNERIDALMRKHWTKALPRPLDLSDTEILDFLGEYCDEMTYKSPTKNYRGFFTLNCDGDKTYEGSLRDAACLAAAKWKERNGD